jgi:short-subunit dehydrogenase
VKELRGRSALITGAGGGLGAYIARDLADEGVNLALTDLPEASVDGLAAELRTRGVEVVHAPADLADRDERRRLIAWSEQALAPIDILVNNAGVEFGGEFLSSDVEALERTMTVNLVATMDLTRLAVPGMSERGRGHIVNIGSVAGKLPTPYLTSYAASKHGVVGFTASLRAELGAEPVGLSVICPGLVRRAGMFARVEPFLETDSIPMGTVAPERVGEAVVRAIRENVGEIVVNPRPVRPIILLNALAPGMATRLSRVRPLRDFLERMARARRRYEEFSPPRR